MVTKTQDGVGKYMPSLPPPPRPLDRAKYGAYCHVDIEAGGNSAGRGGTITNPPLVGYLVTFRTGQLPESTGTAATATAKANNPAKHKTLAKTLRQVLTYGNRNLRYINGD